MYTLSSHFVCFAAGRHARHVYRITAARRDEAPVTSLVLIRASGSQEVEADRYKCYNR
jgi:hypothetical protein